MASVLQYNAKDYNVFIGLDVHLKSYVVNAKDQEFMNRLIKIPANPEALGNFIQKHYNGLKVICAYEVGPTGFGLHDHLVSRNIPCLLVSPAAIPQAGNQRVKTNRIDAEKIARHLKNGDLKPIRVPDQSYRDLRQIIRSREKYVSLRQIAKQQIKSLLLAQSLHYTLTDIEQNWSNRYIERLKELPCGAAVRHRLDLLLDDLTYARQQNLRVLKELKGYCTTHADIELNMRFLESIPGIGFITAATLLADMGDPEYLKNPRELAGFIGLVPSEHSSGDKIIKGPITHSGDAVLRSLLIEAAWTTIRQDKRLEEFYYRIRRKHPAGAGAKKAIVAVARKLTLIIYRVLKDQREYVPY